MVLYTSFHLPHFVSFPIIRALELSFALSNYYSRSRTIIRALKLLFPLLLIDPANIPAEDLHQSSLTSTLTEDGQYSSPKEV